MRVVNLCSFFSIEAIVGSMMTFVYIFLPNMEKHLSLFCVYMTMLPVSSDNKGGGGGFLLSLHIAECGEMSSNHHLIPFLCLAHYLCKLATSCSSFR